MTQADREEWLSVAVPEVSHLPLEALKAGCTLARQTCDHPAKIIPIVLREGEERATLMAVRAALADCPRLAAPVHPERDRYEIELEQDRRDAEACGMSLREYRAMMLAKVKAEMGGE